ncbi:MAG: hypothetical protein DRJ52_02805 [Thermoprotei archaeon]|nr:MAG: hypothetical protein DRJ52_02805 [Thermoprotei archaeon]RLF00185.1 MAG: hypothetical protein DRJ63_03160 [Thermoprotei archaeon]
MSSEEVVCEESALRCFAEILGLLLRGDSAEVVARAYGKNISNLAEAVILVTKLFEGIRIVNTSISSAIKGKRVSVMTVRLRREGELKNKGRVSLLEHLLRETGIPADYLSKETSSIADELGGDPSGILLYLLLLLRLIEYELREVSQRPCE